MGRQVRLVLSTGKEASRSGRREGVWCQKRSTTKNGRPSPRHHSDRNDGTHLPQRQLNKAGAKAAGCCGSGRHQTPWQPSCVTSWESIAEGAGP